MKINWKIVDRIFTNMIFYIDKYDRYTLYAEYRKANGCLEFYPIHSEDFEAYLRVKYREFSKNRDIPSINPILRELSDKAICHKAHKKISPCTRVAGNLKTGIEYYLADSMHQVVSITEHGWKIVKNPSHKFLSTCSFGEQVAPIKSTNTLLELLSPFVNLKGDDLLLFAIWLTQAFSCGSHYGAMLSAERGSGKSTLTRAISALIDPSEVDTSLLQTKLEDFQNYLANHYFASFDNVRTIPTDFSDTLCTAITGGTVVKRKLYSDRDEVRLKLHNTVVINGINIFPRESDLAERFLYFKLKKIKPAMAKSDYDLGKTLETNRPLILGCIFDLLVEASKNIKGLKPKEPTRMMDAYTEMLAIAMALGLSEEEFQRLISNNVKQLNAACEASSPIVDAVVQYMNGLNAGRRKVVESSTLFHTNVKENYTGDKTALFARPAEFSKALKAEVGSLMKAGFGCLVDDTGELGSTVTIIRNKK